MKILIAGNLGYVGPATVRHFRRCFPQAELVGYDMGLFAQCFTGTHSLPEKELTTQHYGDVRNFPPHILENVDAVVNLAAISNDPMGKEFEAATMAVNHVAAVGLAQLCKQYGVKNYVFASSCSMYGAASGQPKKENDSLNPLTAYARSKVAAEQDLAALADNTFTVTCCRFATACGFSDRLRLDLVLNDFVAGAIAAKEITILSDGTPWRPLINVNDMALALEWGAFRQASNGGEFLAINTGSDDWNYQVRDLAEAVAEHIPGIALSINTDAPPDKRSYKVDFALYSELAPNHQPQYTLQKTIDDLQVGLQQMNFTDSQFRESELIRHQVLRRFKAQNLLNDQIAWNE